jgi:hypothetical protein
VLSRLYLIHLNPFHVFICLHRYRGFRQATRGPDTGAFHHPLFRRDEPLLCLNMVCQKLRENKTSASSKRNNNEKTLAVVPQNCVEMIKSPQQVISVTPPPRMKKIQESTSLPPQQPPQSDHVVVTAKNMMTTMAQLAATIDPIPTVSEDGRSSTSSADEDQRQGTLSQIMSPDYHKNCSFSTAITSDVTLTRAALLKADETERLRAAKAMLYESYCMAIRGE